MGCADAQEDWQNGLVILEGVVRMKVGFVCTNFNNSDYTVKAVQTLNSCLGHEYFVVIVDNNSDPVSVRQLNELASRYENIHLIFNSENVGYFRGLNIGIKYLRAHHPEVSWMVVGNNDLEFPIDFSDVLERQAHRLGVHAVISPDIVTIEGEHQNPHVISGIGPVREMMYDLYYSNYYLGLAIQKIARLLPRISERSDEQEWQISRPIYQGHGSCYILGPLFFERFTELWAPTFLMSEEFFLSKQLSDAGLQVYYDPAIRVIHHWHGSLAKLPSRQRWNLAKEAHREYRKYVKGLFCRPSVHR
jgi:GT2 family glycosyltransferase